MGFLYPVYTHTHTIIIIIVIVAVVIATTVIAAVVVRTGAGMKRSLVRKRFRPRRTSSAIIAAHLLFVPADPAQCILCIYNTYTGAGARCGFLQKQCENKNKKGY